ncbi:MAG: DUF4350 domain-containing protein, partial [Candidatus Eremiobacteraeota bacterium]|nr:DUF4350 domain-containing protein [Candidatus Eremiobacteraeota bacterium]
MKGRRIDLAVLAAGVLVLVLLASGREAAQRRQPAPSIYSTYDVGPNGYRALYDVLLSAGVPVRRFQRALGLLDSDVRTLIVSTYADDPAPQAIDARDAGHLSAFVRNGGRLVVLDTDFVGPRDITPGVATSVGARERNAIALAHNRFTAGVAQVRGTIDAVFPFALPRGIPLL